MKSTRQSGVSFAGLIAHATATRLLCAGTADSHSGWERMF